MTPILSPNNERLFVVVEIPAINCVILVVAAVVNITIPQTSQSPAVREMLVMFSGVAVVMLTDEPLAIIDETYSPTLPAVALPTAAVPTMFGVVTVGEVPKTRAPVPVSSVTVAARFALDAVASHVAILALRPLTPVTGIVQFVSVPDDGVPSAGVTSVGDVAKTSAPVPVSSVMVASRLALLATPRKVAMFAARLLTPVTGIVQLVSVPEAGVPNAGVTKVGDVNVPPRMALPVNVIEAGNETVGAPAAPSPLVTVISFAVPVSVRLVNVSAAVCVSRPAVELSAARAVRVASSGW